ncbi:hypothetical protein HSRCO_2174 [Halanaeroarchaeum sp. HSR-CO]|nr:hypothetical protein HSRCO_2174 [Halanaeroarchaeum sp. HSR-CO]
MIISRAVRRVLLIGRAVRPAPQFSRCSSRHDGAESIAGASLVPSCGLLRTAESVVWDSQSALVRIGG